MAGVMIYGSGCMLGQLKSSFEPEKCIWRGRGVSHGGAQMGKNDQNAKIGYALLMVGRKGFQRMPVTFLQNRTQETIPRAMLPAIKIQIWGWGVPHGGAQMGKNDQNPKIGYTLLMVIERGLKGCQSLFFSIELKKLSLEQCSRP